MKSIETRISDSFSNSYYHNNQNYPNLTTSSVTTDTIISSANLNSNISNSNHHDHHAGWSRTDEDKGREEDRVNLGGDGHWIETANHSFNVGLPLLPSHDYTKNNIYNNNKDHDNDAVAVAVTGAGLGLGAGLSWRLSQSLSLSLSLSHWWLWLRRIWLRLINKLRGRLLQFQLGHGKRHVSHTCTRITRIKTDAATHSNSNCTTALSQRHHCLLDSHCDHDTDDADDDDDDDALIVRFSCGTVCSSCLHFFCFTTYS